MGVYEKLWTVVAALCCVAGGAGALAGWPLLVVIGASLLAASFCAIVALPWLPTSCSWPETVAKILLASFAATWVALGMAHLLGIVGLVTAAAVGVVSPSLAPAYTALAARTGRAPQGPR
jgi:hypothetical protein